MKEIVSFVQGSAFWHFERLQTTNGRISFIFVDDLERGTCTKLRTLMCLLIVSRKKESHKTQKQTNKETKTTTKTVQFSLISRSIIRFCFDYSIYSHGDAGLRVTNVWWIDFECSNLMTGNYRSMKLTRILEIRVNFSHVNFFERP